MAEVTAKGIENNFKDIKTLIERVEQEGKELEPVVLAHFNQYVKDVINPQLPEGYELLEAEDAFFFIANRGWNIVTGNVSISDVALYLPTGLSNRIKKLCRGYVVNNPWVRGFTYKFRLNRLHE